MQPGRGDPLEQQPGDYAARRAAGQIGKRLHHIQPSLQKIDGDGHQRQRQNDANAAKSKYVDDKAMNVIAAGFERRFDVIESNANDDDPHSTENIQEAIEAEIKNDKELKNARFKDSKMQQDVITYLNLLDDQLKVTEDYSQSSADYYEEWNKVYDKRSAQLKKLVDNYGLEVGENIRMISTT